jgi:hypothetical protein
LPVRDVHLSFLQQVGVCEGALRQEERWNRT